MVSFEKQACVKVAEISAPKTDKNLITSVIVEFGELWLFIGNSVTDRTDSLLIC